MLKRVAVKTARAWALKEHSMAAWRYRSRHWARKELLRWYSWAIRSRLEPVKEVARMVKSHLEGLVNAIHHGVTNARSEGINSRISGSSSPPAASAIGSGSALRSTSTSEVST